MPIDENTEKREADKRARLRQDKKVPFLINEEDGRLYPNTPLMRKRQGYRLYHGPAKSSVEDRRRYLLGLGSRRSVAYEPAPEEPFDLNTADIDALLTFASDQYGVILDPNKPIKKLRDEVFRLSQLPEHELLGVIGDVPQDTRFNGAGPGAPDDDDEDIAAARALPSAGDPAAVAAAVAKQRAQTPEIPRFTAGLGAGAQPAGAAIESTPPTRGGRQPRKTAPATA